MAVKLGVQGGLAVQIGGRGVHFGGNKAKNVFEHFPLFAFRIEAQQDGHKLCFERLGALR